MRSVIGVDSSTGVLTRKRWPSADTSYLEASEILIDDGC